MTYTDESMDLAIDDAARERTAAPAPALRARVVARLRPQPSRRASWLAPAAVTLATATVVVLLVTRRVTPPSVTGVAPAVASSQAMEQPVSASAPSPKAHGPDAQRPAMSRVDTTTITDSDAPAWRERAIPALEAVPDLTMAAIQPTTLPIAQLEVAPIASATPLVIRAIGSDR